MNSTTLTGFHDLQTIRQSNQHLTVSICRNHHSPTSQNRLVFYLDSEGLERVNEARTGSGRLKLQ